MKRRLIEDSFLLVYRIIFLIFIGGTMALGRSFSILHLRIAGRPFFITELMLIISLPVLVAFRGRIMDLPRFFSRAMLMFFILGGLYLAWGMITHNPYSVRDIVLSGYLLFFPLTVIVFSDRRVPIIFLFILGVADIFAFFAGRSYIMHIGLKSFQEAFIYAAKPVNFGLMYAVATAFLISFSGYLKKWAYVLAAVFIFALNFYALFILGIRTLWVAYLLLPAAMFFLIGKRQVLCLARSFPVILVLTIALYFIDRPVLISTKDDSMNKEQIIVTKMNSLFTFVSGNISREALESKDAQPDPNDSPEKIRRAREVYQFAKEYRIRHNLPDIGLAVPKKFSEFFDNIIWRFDIWRQAVEFGMRNPWFGRGFGNYPQYVVWGYRTLPPQGAGLNSGITPAHNEFVTVFFKMGIIGLSLFVLINAYCFFFALRSLRRIQAVFTRSYLIGCIGALFFWHITACFYDVIESPSTSLILWFFMGLIFSLIHNDEKLCNQKKD